MAIFPNLQTESVVQVSDKTRLNASKSFVVNEADVTEVRIKPEASESYISVFNTDKDNWYLDWQYTGVSREVTASVEVTTGGVPVEVDVTFNVVTVSDDSLFSSDQDLTQLEPDILNWVRAGRNSFLDVHRRVRDTIVDWFSERGVRKFNKEKLEASDFDKEEIRLWSAALTLHYIFSGISNQVDDVFSIKANEYLRKANTHKDRVSVHADLNGDGTIDDNEVTFIQFGRLKRL